MIPTLRSRLDELIWSDKLERRGVAGRIAAVILRYLFGLIRDGTRRSNANPMDKSRDRLGRQRLAGRHLEIIVVVSHSAN